MGGNEQQHVTTILEYLNSVGTLGLTLIVAALYFRKLITWGEFEDYKVNARREFDREVERANKLDARLERALHIGDRAMDASDKLAERLPAKN